MKLIYYYKLKMLNLHSKILFILLYYYYFISSYLLSILILLLKIECDNTDKSSRHHAHNHHLLHEICIFKISREIYMYLHTKTTNTIAYSNQTIEKLLYYTAG